MSAIAKTIPFAEYLADPSLNNSWLKRMGKSEKEFWHNEPRRETPALRIGRPIHTRILEPDKFARSIEVWRGGMTKAGKPTTSKNSSEYKDLVKSAELDGRQVLDESEADLCEAMAAAVNSHKIAGKYLSGGKAEESIFWTNKFGLKCKIRVDMLHKWGLVDLKSTIDVGRDNFGRSSHRFEYHVQGALYQDGVFALTGNRIPVYIVAIEKTLPHDIVVYEVTDDALNLGRSVYEDRMAKVRACRESNEYRGVSDEVCVLELPDYAYTQHLDAAIDWNGL